MTLPHENVRVRLGVSGLHGVGVFAIAPIAAGADVFPGDDRPIRWVEQSALVGLTPEEQRLYDDFGVLKDGWIGCPESFDQLSVGWYVNEPEPGTRPNLTVAPDFAMTAARDIAAGEELTAVYASFSEPR